MLNPDGVVNGMTRCNYAGLDLNRQFREPQMHCSPTVCGLKELLRSASNVEFFFDLHGHAKKDGLFFYGNSFPMPVMPKRRNSCATATAAECRQAANRALQWTTSGAAARGGELGAARRGTPAGGEGLSSPLKGGGGRGGGAGGGVAGAEGGKMGGASAAGDHGAPLSPDEMAAGRAERGLNRAIMVAAAIHFPEEGGTPAEARGSSAGVDSRPVSSPGAGPRSNPSSSSSQQSKLLSPRSKRNMRPVSPVDGGGAAVDHQHPADHDRNPNFATRPGGSAGGGVKKKAAPDNSTKKPKKKAKKREGKKGDTKKTKRNSVMRRNAALIMDARARLEELNHHIQLLPEDASRLKPDLFVWDNASFDMGKSKAVTARCVIFDEFRCLKSYVLEAGLVERRTELVRSGQNSSSSEGEEHASPENLLSALSTDLREQDLQYQALVRVRPSPKKVSSENGGPGGGERGVVPGGTGERPNENKSSLAPPMLLTYRRLMAGGEAIPTCALLAHARSDQIFDPRRQQLSLTDDEMLSGSSSDYYDSDDVVDGLDDDLESALPQFGICGRAISPEDARRADGTSRKFTNLFTDEGAGATGDESESSTENDIPPMTKVRRKKAAAPKKNGKNSGEQKGGKGSSSKEKAGTSADRNKRTTGASSGRSTGKNRATTEGGGSARNGSSVGGAIREQLIFYQEQSSAASGALAGTMEQMLVSQDEADELFYDRSGKAVPPVLGSPVAGEAIPPSLPSSYRGPRPAAASFFNNHAQAANKNVLHDRRRPTRVGSSGSGAAGTTTGASSTSRAAAAEQQHFPPAVVVAPGFSNAEIQFQMSGSGFRTATSEVGGSDIERDSMAHTLRDFGIDDPQHSRTQAVLSEHHAVEAYGGYVFPEIRRIQGRCEDDGTTPAQPPPGAPAPKRAILEKRGSLTGSDSGVVSEQQVAAAGPGFGGAGPAVYSDGQHGEQARWAGSSSSGGGSSGPTPEDPPPLEEDGEGSSGTTSSSKKGASLRAMRPSSLRYRRCIHSLCS